MSFSTSDVVGTLNSRFSFEQEVNIKKVNIWERFFKISFAQPKIIEVNNKSNSIEIKSISQLFFWLFKNRKKYNLFIVEDVAQAFGSKFKDKHLGTYGDAGCFSFFPSKNLSRIKNSI